MNVSMQDAFNLGWKLASVLRGRCSPEILRTYSVERQSVAKELIDFDRKWSATFSVPPKIPSTATARRRSAEFQRYFIKQARFTAGTETRYAPSIISGKLIISVCRGLHDRHAPSLAAGDRLADAKTVELGHTIKADGRWRASRSPMRQPRRFVLEAQGPAPVPRSIVANFPGHAAHSGRSGYRLGNRRPGDIPAEPSRIGYRSNAGFLLLWIGMIKVSLLEVRCRGHRSNEGVRGRRAAGPVCRPRSSARRLFRGSPRSSVSSRL